MVTNLKKESKQETRTEGKIWLCLWFWYAGSKGPYRKVDWLISWVILSSISWSVTRTSHSWWPVYKIDEGSYRHGAENRPAFQKVASQRVGQTELLTSRLQRVPHITNVYDFLQESSRQNNESVVDNISKRTDMRLRMVDIEELDTMQASTERMAIFRRRNHFLIFQQQETIAPGWRRLWLISWIFNHLQYDIV